MGKVLKFIIGNFYEYAKLIITRRNTFNYFYKL